MGAEEKKEKEESKEKDLDRMTVKALRALAAETTDLVGVHAMKKAELLAAIKEEKAIKEEPEVKEEKAIKEEKAPKKEVEKGAITVKQLKAKIVELKEKREEARKTKDKRTVDILRRRINRARKRTRKISQV